MAKQAFYNPDIKAYDDGTPDWLLGYTSSDPKSANTENSNAQYFAPGEAAVGYKKVWDRRPVVFPNGEGDDGSL